MCNKSLLLSPSKGLSNTSITPAACRLVCTHHLTKVSSINISLRKLISVINTSCSGSWWNSATTPLTGQNDTRRLIKSTNYSNWALVYQFIFNKQSHCLPSCTRHHHIQEAPTRVHLAGQEQYCFCCQRWSLVLLSPGATKTKNGDECLHTCQCDISILLQENTHAAEQRQQSDSGA